MLNRNNRRVPLKSGTILSLTSQNHYEIIDVVGYGGSCLVYRAKVATATSDGGDARTVIIKELYPAELAGSAFGVSRGTDGSLVIPAHISNAFNSLKSNFNKACKESIAYYDLTAEYTLPLPDFFTANNTVYSVLDAIEGTTLSESHFTHKDAEIDVRQVSGLMVSLCNAVSVIHNANKLYLDIKPDNIWLFPLVPDTQRRVALLDFGSVAFESDINKKDTIPAVTEDWAAPEIQNLKEGIASVIDKRADIFSIGMIFFWLLSGRRPSQADLMSIFPKYSKPSFDLSSTRCGTGLNAETVNLILQILKKSLHDQPANRYVNVGSLRADFKTVCDRLIKNLTVIEAFQEIQQDSESKVIVKIDASQMETSNLLLHVNREHQNASERRFDAIERKLDALHVMQISVAQLNSGLPASASADQVQVTKGGGGWGPERETYTSKSPAPHPVFNSMTDNPALGDERLFVRVREADVDRFGFTADIVPGKEYEVFIFFHNNAADKFSTMESRSGVAQNTRILSSFPKILNRGEIGTAMAYITATNAVPNKIWASVTLATQHDELRLSYVPASARIYNNGKANASVLSSNLFGDKGTFVGLHKLDGLIPGLVQCSGYVVYRIRAEVSSFFMKKSVKAKTLERVGGIYKVAAGDIVTFAITFKNGGTMTHDDILLCEALPQGFEYLSGSTMLTNYNNPNGKGISDSLMTDGGINIGSYAPGASAIISFQAIARKSGEAKTRLQTGDGVKTTSLQIVVV